LHVGAEPDHEVGEPAGELGSVLHAPEPTHATMHG
jgi:hypothetical protein